MIDFGEFPEAASAHSTPRMGNRPHDPAYDMLSDHLQSTPRVHRASCYICRDMEFARMGLPLCTPCCKCSQTAGKAAGHIAADDESCDDCSHQVCDKCHSVPGQAEICTCDSPCCELTGYDIGVPFAGVAYSCGSQHCPTHGTSSEDRPAS